MFAKSDGDECDAGEKGRTNEAGGGHDHVRLDVIWSTYCEKRRKTRNCDNITRMNKEMYRDYIACKRITSPKKSLYIPVSTKDILGLRGSCRPI